MAPFASRSDRYRSSSSKSLGMSRGGSRRSGGSQCWKTSLRTVSSSDRTSSNSASLRPFRDAVKYDRACDTNTWQSNLRTYHKWYQLLSLQYQLACFFLIQEKDEIEVNSPGFTQFSLTFKHRHMISEISGPIAAILEIAEASTRMFVIWHVSDVCVASSRTRYKVVVSNRQCQTNLRVG